MGAVAGILICVVVWTMQSVYRSYTTRQNWREFAPWIRDSYDNIWILKKHPCSEYWIKFFEEKCGYTNVHIVTENINSLVTLFPANSLNGIKLGFLVNDGTGMFNLNQFERSVMSSMSVEEQDNMWNTYVDKTRW